MKVNKSAVVFFAVLLLLSVQSHAELFKWVDDRGKVHYSDKKPDEQVQSKIVEVEQTPRNADVTQQSFAKAIIRPYEKTTRTLFLPDTLYAWRKDSAANKIHKVGAYYVGKACTSRGAMKTPEVYITHNAFFPEESSNAYTIKKIINSLDYEAVKTTKYKLLDNLKHSGGLSLHSEIVDLDFNTCAPHLSRNDRLTPVRKLASHVFKKHRIKLGIRWQLRDNREQDLLYEATTDGQYSGWHTTTSPGKAFASAVEAATIRLFSDQAFIDKIVEDKDTARHSANNNNTTAPADNSSEQQDESFFSRMFSYAESGSETALGKIINNKFVLKAQLAQIFADMSKIKILLNEYYVHHGVWPGGLSDVGLSKSSISDSKSLAGLIIQADGSIIAELTDAYGPNRIVQLSPHIEDQQRFMDVRWRCTSNLSKDMLPANCQSL